MSRLSNNRIPDLFSFWRALLKRRAGTEDAPLDSAAALRSLAALLENCSPRAAVGQWPNRVPAAVRPACERTARRVALGAPVTDALQAEPSFGLWSLPLWDHGALVAALRDRASELERRAEQARAIGAHVAGMRLSARIVGWLPLAFVPLLAGAGSVRLTPLDGALVVIGLLLSFAGARWMAVLVPAPPPGACAARMAQRAAAALGSGRALRVALSTAAEGEGDPALHSALSAVRLGAPWPAALGASDDAELQALGALLGSLDGQGVPVAQELLSFAEDLEHRERMSFEAALKRAPVKMALPLTLCVLPACGLLGVGPLLRNFGG